MKGILAAAAATLLLASAARADEIRVPGDVRRLEDALYQASPGDTILLGRGTWRGPFTVATPGVTLQGEEGARIRGPRDRHRRRTFRAALTVAAPGVTVRGITFVQGAVEAGSTEGIADGFTLEDCTFLRRASSNGASAVYILGTDMAVLRNRFQLSGDRDNQAAAILVTGPGAVVSGNEFGGRVPWRSAIRIRGDASRAEENAVGPVILQGIVVLGDGGTVAGNELSGADLEVWGDGAAVTGNSTLGAPSGLPSIWIVGSGNSIEGNESLFAGDSGLIVWGNDNDLAGNTVSFSGSDPGGATPGHGIVIRGTGNRLLGNTSLGAFGEGIRIAGSGGLGWDMNGDAIDPTGAGNGIDRCTSTGAGSCGLGNWLPGTTVTGCTFTGNGTDVVDGSGFDLFQGNTFQTGGPGFTGSGGDGGPLDDYGIFGGPFLGGD